MKKIMIIMVVVLVAAMAGTTMAADTSTLTVSATVVGTCKFSTGGATLDFGSLDPSVGSNVSATPATVQFWCTKGVTTDAITAGNGGNWSGTSRQMIGPGSDLIAYSLNLAKDANANAGPASPRTLTITGQVLGPDYTAKSAGSYSDTVTLSINP